MTRKTEKTEGLRRITTTQTPTPKSRIDIPIKFIITASWRRCRVKGVNLTVSADVIASKEMTMPMSTCTILDLVLRATPTPGSRINSPVKFIIKFGWSLERPKAVNLSTRPVSADVMAIRKMTMPMNMCHVSILDLTPEFALGNMNEKRHNRN
ncbi:hypothetical protein AgCh_017736 [Apium graveolens]